VPHAGHGEPHLPVFGPAGPSDPPVATPPPHSTTHEVPALESYPGAAAKLYLDFNGHSEPAWGAFHDIEIPAYDIDGDPSTFSNAEVLNIIAIWRRVAEDYAPFNINVTTIDPITLSESTDLRVAIGGDGAWTGAVNGGISYTGLFADATTPHVVFVFSDNLGGGNARMVAESISHEAGHAFGLDHQSVYDADGNLTEEYNPGDADHAPIMGDSFGAQRGVWWYGPNDQSATTMQDDMAVIAGAVGWRPDDAGDTPDLATPLDVNNQFVTGGGIIGKMSDVDAWSFETDDGTVMFQVSVPAGINNLDAKVELLDANGNEVVSWQDPAGSYDALLVATVPSGSYRLMVGSHGAYGDVGNYLISGVVVPPGSVLTPPTDLSAQAVGPNQIQLTWDDNAVDETGYQIERALDGADWMMIAQVDADSAFYADVGLDPATIYNYRVTAVQGIAISEYTNEASAATWPAMPMGPTELQVAAVAFDQIHLTWHDHADNETGFVVEHSVNGVDWLEIARPLANLTSYDDGGLNATTTYMYRVRAVNGRTASDDSNLASTATLAATPNAPSDLKAVAIAANQINLTWKDNAAIETGYTVECSPNGTAWATIASLPAGSTAYSNTGLQAATAYYYRVRAVNAGVTSDSSNVTLAVTLPNAPPSPTGLKAFAAHKNALLLTWVDNSGNATGYKVMRSSDGVTWAPVGFAAAHAKNFRVARPNRSHTYYYAVVGVNAGGDSALSNVIVVKFNSMFRAASNRLFSGIS